MTDRPTIKLAPLDLPTDINVEERLVYLNDQVQSLLNPATTVTLNTIPSPQITESLTANGAGVEFSFNQLTISGIDGYRIYRNTSNSFSGATQLQYLKHASLTTTSVTVRDITANGTVYYYWVTAVSTSGIESSPAAAQAASVTSGSVVSAVGNVILKNVAIVNATTSGPTIASATYAVVPDMTKTVTTNGNNVLLHFMGTFQMSAASQLFLRFGMDGGFASQEYTWSFPTAGVNSSVDCLVVVGGVSAGSHTFNIQWHTGNGTITATAVGTVRQLELIELG